ncbi:molybdenum cofactor biosysynthesis protein [Mycobacterium sp. 852013-51886_SCH5428379]|uniref:MOSC domain-containing protein n=1 Tax=Mycobacterium sp. 852013-51886_SCH5428379 TaxID=1834111 RepID=UPI0007FB721C|nr:MOSC domain-containing protein [Mycobacterium sp. 852013-51886_SCH5428379]OBB60442.1 molybdenum cofactor biosysynthesis protein [Mycobacterium sp. 852013-51886_SCH5428379]
MSCVLTVNVAQPRPNPAKPSVVTGIVKVPTDGPVAVRAPGKRGASASGIESDTIGNRRLHGGDDQAVYAYAREDLDSWQSRLNRTLGNGDFGENLTTAGIDVTHAVIGERWHVGDDGLILEVTSPRTPCKTFAAWLQVPGLIKTFTDHAEPGAYLRVITPGTVRAGDRVVVTDRPGHGVTVQTVFRAILREPELLDQLLDIEALPADIRRKAERRNTRTA